MADAKRDSNQVPTLIAVSNADGVTPVVLWADPVTHRLLVDASGGGANTALSNLASVAINTALLPGTSDSIALGSATKQWSDLFLGSGGTIDFNNGNAVITHSAGILTVSTGDLRVTTAGTNAASVVTVGGTQTLTNKTLTSPTLGTSPTAAGATWPDLGTVTTVDINGGTIDGVTIGGASAGAITGTTITANTGFMPDANDGAYLGQAGTAFSDLFLALGAVINFDSGNMTITHSAGVLTIGGGTLALGANSLTLTGSIAATGARVTKGWFTDIESTNMPTVGGTAILTSLTAPQFTTIELGHASDTTLSRAAAGRLAVEGANVVTESSTDTLTNKTLTSPTINTANIGGITQLAEGASISLDAAGSADGAYSGITIAGTAGAALAFGDLVYLAAADSRWELADADAASTSGDVILGMCVLAAAGDGSATRILLYGNIRADAVFPALTIGAPAYVGVTAGDIQTTQPSGTDDVIRRVGFALTADELLFNPSNDYITHT